jgi:hypothetical protein
VNSSRWVKRISNAKDAKVFAKKRKDFATFARAFAFFAFAKPAK